MIGMPAATKPPKTSTITRKLIGRAIPSPARRSVSTWEVIASMRSASPPVVPLGARDGGDEVVRTACRPAPAPGRAPRPSSPRSKVTTAAKPSPEVGSSALAAGLSSPRARAGARRPRPPRRSRPMAAAAARTAATVAGAAASAPVTWSRWVDVADRPAATSWSRPWRFSPGDGRVAGLQAVEQRLVAEGPGRAARTRRRPRAAR